jgi:hypothetical protein
LFATSKSGPTGRSIPARTEATVGASRLTVVVAGSTQLLDPRWQGGEGYPLLLDIDMNDPDLEKVSDLDDLVRVFDKLRRQATDMDQAVAIRP